MISRKDCGVELRVMSYKFVIASFKRVTFYESVKKSC